MSYIEDLNTLVCNQAQNYIKKVLRPEDIDNDERSGFLSGDRESQDYELLQLLDPKYTSKNGNSLTKSNDPLYPSNMIDSFNGPFDHIDRILLQDFSNTLFSSGSNYFRDLFNVEFSSNSIVNCISMSEDGIDYSIVNDKFKFGRFFIDSFTYTPFIDYSTIDSKVGIYSDEYLTKYNTGWYDIKSNFVDCNRRNMTSNLYELRNLEKDLYDAKIAFRNAITQQDKKVYIYTLCEHLITLFAKLSNIRMCHEFYGLNSPHSQWDGIIALDIWYNMLYKEIDCGYAFDESYFDVNPMSKLEIHVQDGRRYVEYQGEEYDVSDEPYTFGDYTIMTDGVDDGYALLWDEYVFKKVDSTARKINDDRKWHVLPRGVLCKIHSIVSRQVPINRILDDSTGDFEWFKQSGNVYSDSSKSRYTKFSNLHLGRAYDVMTPTEYCAFTNTSSVDGKYSKPLIEGSSSDMKKKMLVSGCEALQDAFSVIRNEKLFNIFNLSSNQVEEFNPDNIEHYSESQCAIVIERIFSRLYKYLQFKSTTFEQFVKHINIDSGYKYLTTESLLKNDHVEYQNGSVVKSVYYDEHDMIPYLRYMSKLREYLDSDVLSADEKEVLRNVVGDGGILTKIAYEWLGKNWNLCPLQKINTEYAEGNCVDDTPNDDCQIEMNSNVDDVTQLMNERESEDSEPMVEDNNGVESEITTVIGSDDGQFTLTFKYLNESGEVTPVEVKALKNSPIPMFHIHSKIDCGDFFKEFRYWRVESGNISSSNTILSDVVLVAVYDEVEKPSDYVADTEHVNPNELNDEFGQQTNEALKCEFNENGCCVYITNGNGICDLNPIKNLFDDDGGSCCPFVQLFKFGINHPFDVSTIIEISDVVNLIQALLKINIDIAHREYFLKIDIPNDTDWWYGYSWGDDYIVCHDSESVEDGEVVCGTGIDQIVCRNEVGMKWVSFEPTIEYKFSNMHASNQVKDGRLICCCSNATNYEPVGTIVSVNRELMDDDDSNHYNDYLYHYDYVKQFSGIAVLNEEKSKLKALDDCQRYYAINPLCLYENSIMQSPIDVNGFVKHRLEKINRTDKQVQTFTSIVKKYRPIIIPSVHDIFNGKEYKSKYQVHNENTYGVFGWCTIPSKTMVNMEYNENSIIVPSSYDKHNHVCGSNFLQMDSDLSRIYRIWDSELNKPVSNIKDTWYYLYNQRDWTYFLNPFFNVDQNNDVYTYILDTYRGDDKPNSSDHLNGVIFEPSIQGRAIDSSFGGIAETCRFMAKYHHNQKNLETLVEISNQIISFGKLKKLTTIDGYEYNSTYGSEYKNLPLEFRYPDGDGIDDANKSGTHLGGYRYNLGWRHSIDDFDENSVWLYITMTTPIEEQNTVIELKDIMPYVFWWSNRGYMGDIPDPIVPDEPEPPIRVIYHENPPSS